MRTMQRIKRIFSVVVVLSVLLGAVAVPVSALATDDSTTTDDTVTDPQIQAMLEIIEALKAQIAQLQIQIQELQEARKEVKATAKEIVQLSRQLWQGVRGDDVELLQEILATDPDIYPEGLVTGYFGPLTYAAVKKFQAVAGIEQVGRVGPKTMSKINELLTEGAGKSGKVPPGLLIAPGIRKKLPYVPQPLPGQKLPPGIAKKIATTTPEEPDETPPVISDVASGEITVDSATITWTTDEEADSKVYYSTATPVVVTSTTPVVTSTDMVEEHSIVLSGLTQGTTYYYVVSSADESDNTATSAEYSFTTAEPDTTPPVISGVAATNTTAVSVHIIWETDESADSRLWYSTSSPVATDGTPDVTDSTLVADHTVPLSGLATSTTYYYVVGSADSSDNLATSSESSFTTLSE